jgi:hypothetical protein
VLTVEMTERRTYQSMGKTLLQKKQNKIEQAGNYNIKGT